MANLRNQTRDKVNWVQSLGPHGLKDFFIRVDHASGGLSLLYLIFVEGMMKQGIILYLLAGGELPDGVEPGTHYQVLSHPAGPMEFVVSRQGTLELDDAWHFLLSLGCEKIDLLVTLADHGRLRLLYPRVRLSDLAWLMEEPSEAGLQRRVLH
jgi:hypothetical protein